MSTSVLSHDILVSRRRASTWLYKQLPIWTLLTFAGTLAVAYSPGVIHLFNLLDDYDVLTFKSQHFFLHLEAAHLFSIARPVAALLTNAPLWPVRSAADFRWVRIFAILTVFLIGAQLMANCVVRLHTRALDALAVALAVFLGMAFIYATMDLTAWTPHLLSTFLAVGAYTRLGRSNALTLPFVLLSQRRDWRAMLRQLPIYFFSRPVWTACLIYELALYDYPPFALLIAVFPVIGILFSQAPRAYRTLVAVRDIFFLCICLVIYSLSTALIYLPFVRLFTRMGTGDASAYENKFVASLYASYQFAYNTHLGVIVSRLGQMLLVSGDLWFLPQSRFHLLTGAILVLAVLLANRPRARTAGDDTCARLRFDSWASDGIVTVTTVTICILIASAPVWGSAGGFVQYRTVVAPTALIAIAFIFAVRSIAAMVWIMVGNPTAAAAKAANVAIGLTIGAAFAANFYANYAITKLGRNEFAYFTEIARRAVENKSKTVFLIDQRPPGIDVSMVYDQKGRWVPPYELSCFASYCMETGATLRVAAAQFGLPLDALNILVPRGDSPVPGLTCDMLTSPTPHYPASASDRSVAIINYYRTLGPLTCVMVSMAWHDIGIDLSQELNERHGLGDQTEASEKDGTGD